MNKKLSSIVHRCTDEHLRPLRRSIVKSCCPDRFAWSRAAVTRQVLIQFQRRCQIESNREYRGHAQRNARSSSQASSSRLTKQSRKTEPRERRAVDRRGVSHRRLRQSSVDVLYIKPYRTVV